ncbi:MAG: hypothetical protein JNK77_11325, partial [Saprospiraceae bacterium]|nr:hypothetical protein [Saprospiraceae bacterium]
MKKCIWLVLFLTSTALRGQYFEAGILAGVSNYMGDLSANSSKVYIG